MTKSVLGRVLAVDDSKPFLRAATTVVSATDGLQIVGSAASGEEAVRLLPRLKPDLVLLDIRMPGIDGLETTRRIVETAPHTVVFLLSAEPEGFEASGAAAGAAALLDKRDLSPESLEQLWLEHGPASD
jgi:DNA-binding NarL/FixJ family response regulator